MAIVSKALYGVAPPPVTETLLYTAPSALGTEVLSLWINNTTNATATISLSIVRATGAAGVANRILQAKAVPANDIIVIACQEHMDQNDFISGLQATAGAINVRINGIEVS